MKTCKECNETKSLLDFHVNRRTLDGKAVYCKDCKNKKARKVYSNNPAKANLNSKTQYNKDRVKVNIRSREWALNNPDRCKEIYNTYASNNKDNRAVISANRRAKKLNQTPLLNEEQKQDIDILYKVSRWLSVNTDTQYHIDHIHPLSKGGLHMPANLQILTATENMSKGAK